MKRFEVGKIYSTRSACDYDQILTWEVVSRTEKTVTLRDAHGYVNRRKVKTGHADAEWCYPRGLHSMAPAITAGE